MTHEIDFKFCPKCAAPLLRQTPILLTCSACYLHYYVNPRTTNAIILQNSKNQLLLTKRKFDPHAGKYDLPGGFIDINESVEESVIRELGEELEIVMSKDDIKYLGSCTDTYEFKGLTYYTIGMVFKTLVKDDIILTPSDDVESTLWVPVDHIPYDEIAFEGVKTFMKSYFSSIT